MSQRLQRNILNHSTTTSLIQWPADDRYSVHGGIFSFCHFSKHSFTNEDDKEESFT